MFFTRLTPLFNHQYPTIIVSTNIQLHILISVRRGTGVDTNSSITIARWNHCYVSLRSLRLLRPRGSLGYLSVNYRILTKPLSLYQWQLVALDLVLHNIQLLTFMTLHDKAAHHHYTFTILFDTKYHLLPIDFKSTQSWNNVQLINT